MYLQTIKTTLLRMAPKLIPLNSFLTPSHALRNMARLSKESTVTIYLQNGDHYLVRKDYEFYSPAYTDLNSFATNVIIMPLPCTGSNDATCVADEEKVTIYNKIGADFEFPVWRSFDVVRHHYRLG